MSDHIPSLGGGELFEEVNVAARQALSVARRRSPHLRRSFVRGRTRGQQVGRFTVSRARRIRSTSSLDRTETRTDAQRAATDRLDAGDLSRAAMLARWATAVAAAEAAQQIVADLADSDPGRAEATIDAEQAQIQADAWEERLRAEEGIDVAGLAAQPDIEEATELDETSALADAATAATTELSDADLEPVPETATVGDLLEQSGLGIDSPAAGAEAGETSFAPADDLAPAVDLDAAPGLDT